jgi:pimeloyl-ACP methyl ester carboxylesterase
MAARWAAAHPGRLDGLVLLAAYPDRPLPEDLPVLVLYGSEDGVLNRSNLEKSASLLPPDAVVRQLPGGNHANFGSYGAQRGDGIATVTPEAQWAWTAEWIGRMVNGDLPQSEKS